MTTLDIRQFPCLTDNYGYLIRDPVSGEVAAIDTPDADAIVRTLDANGWRLDWIWNTHWHPDHTGANRALKEAYGCKIRGPRAEAAKIPGLDLPCDDGDSVALGAQQAQVLATPGHTLGHIVFHFADAKVAFVGDTLFALGCGRLFEGTPAQMWASLARLAALPDATKIYCAHEYTQANARFALSVDADNPRLRAQAEEINAKRAQNQPTVPTTIRREKDANPFLRAPQLRPHLSPVEAFAEIRAAKDAF